MEIGTSKPILAFLLASITMTMDGSTHSAISRKEWNELRIEMKTQGGIEAPRPP
jgi:hypothetical protein